MYTLEDVYRVMRLSYGLGESGTPWWEVVQTFQAGARLLPDSPTGKLILAHVGRKCLQNESLDSFHQAISEMAGAKAP